MDVESPQVKLPEFNHPINWGTLKDVGPNTFATVETDKGEVILEFYHKKNRLEYNELRFPN